MATVKRPGRRTAAVTRRARADATRQRIVTAAADLFRENGYAATTMAAIARRSRVAVQTVYFTFHTKTALLAAVANQAITGGTAVAPEQAAWVQSVLAERDGARRIALVVEATAQIAPRMLPIADAWHAAIAADPSAATEYRARLVARRQFLRRVIEQTQTSGQLKLKLDPERAADILFAMTTPESYASLTDLLGWSVQYWKSWVTALLVRELLRG
ncbi:MAG: TetR/AcrR family transcriptional regulator [Chloroflexota bacterium]|nr:TetR/AcrR family transcriptional regulator [Chloroflexota bacterium]